MLTLTITNSDGELVESLGADQVGIWYDDDGKIVDEPWRRILTLLRDDPNVTPGELDDGASSVAERIARMLSGEEWDTSVIENVAEELRNAGYIVDDFHGDPSCPDSGAEMDENGITALHAEGCPRIAGNS
jgi:hypothetical protein